MQMKKNKKLMVGMLPIVGVILFLIFTNSADSATTEEVTLEKVVQNPEKYKEKMLMLQGNLIETSVQWDAEKTLLTFDIKDQDKTIAVEYIGVKPDTFTDGTIVIVDGIYDVSKKVLYAERLRTRCPSKYEAMDKEANKEAYEQQHMKKE